MAETDPASETVCLKKKELTKMDKSIISSVFRVTNVLVSQNSSVGVATGYGLDGRGSIPRSGKRFFSSPQRPDWLWGSPSLLSNGYRRLSGDKTAGA
jgi:hypothetical protein